MTPNTNQVLFLIGVVVITRINHNFTNLNHNLINFDQICKGHILGHCPSSSMQLFLGN